MITIYSMNSRMCTLEELETALELLTPERKAKALRFRRLEDRNKGICTGMLERYVLQRHIGMKNYELAYNEQGKPRVKGHDDINYNLSHSGDWIVCAIAKEQLVKQALLTEHPVANGALGIDLEQEVKYSERIVKRYFHMEEQEYILSLPMGEREKAFARCWTMKEGYMKLTGAGFAISLKDILTRPEYGEILYKEELVATGEFIPIEKGYQCFLCTNKKQDIHRINISLGECIKGVEAKSNHHQRL